MSARGIEIHNGYLVFPEGMPQELHLGTEASPLTQGEAGQIVVSAVINALALGGTVEAGLFMVVGSVDLTGNLRGVHVKARVNDLITLTGWLFGVYIETEVLGTGTVTQALEGIRIEQYAPSGATVTETIYGIHIANSIEVAPSAYSFIRLSENAASTVTSVLFIAKGGDCLGMTYFMEVIGTADGMFCSSSGTVSSPDGFITVRIHQKDRYIALYSAK